MAHSQLVTSVSQAIENIHRYNQQVSEFPKNIPLNRSWYAVKMKEGKWQFAPAKFIGYQNMKLKKSGSDDDRDGRIADGILQGWAEPIEAGHPQYENLRDELRKFCAQYGKKPSKKTRIAMLDPDAGGEIARPSFNDELVNLMAAVFQGLTPAQQNAFRRQINA